MTYNPEKHQRGSIRLRGYDYSKTGKYFITLCSQNRECMFGDVENFKMKLNDPGVMIRKWIVELKNKFENIDLDEFIIMPNHIHAIITNFSNDRNVGANLCVRPFEGFNQPDDKQYSIIGKELFDRQGPYKGQTHRSAPTLGEIIQWFKTMSTNEYI